MRDTLALYGGEKTTHLQFPAWPQFAERTFTDILEPLRSGRVASWSGQKVAELESRWAAWTGVKHAVACSSGTAALHMALQALGIGAGDDVIVPARTFASTALAVLHAGARPVFCDVGDDQVIDPRSAEERLTPRTRAVLVVHLFGIVCPMDRLSDLARRHSLFIIEDCAQCAGGEFNGRLAGSLGNAGCFSFSQGKHVCAGGEGGMVTTDDPRVAAACRSLRDYGRDAEAGEKAGEGGAAEGGATEGGATEGGRAHVQAGFNYRLTEMQAVVALNELDRLPHWNLARRAGFAKVYKHALSHLPGVRSLPLNTEVRRNAWWKYPLQVNLAELTCDGAELRRALVAEGIPDGGAHWPEAYAEPVFAGEQHPPCPNARAVRERTIALLLPPTWEKQHVETCASAVRKLLHAYRR